MRKALIIMLLAVGGCVTDHPVIPQRYQLGTPVACADYINPKTVVLIGHSAGNKREADGNTYTIEWRCATNSNSNATDDPVVISANADLATNVWPKFRMHLDLSVDGGASWIRRIGYGLQTPKSGIGSDFVWSPPDDYSLLTTNAKLRIVDLDGRIVRGMTNGAPYDVPTNGIQSAEFAIVGAVVDVPAAGATLYPDTPQTVTWRQVGGGTNAEIFWVTPDSSALITTVSNVVNGLNSASINLPVNLPVVSEMRLCVRGVEYPSIIGYSGTFTVSP
jgi:hypothetical protein